jgi:hypothetical protein
MIQFGMSTEFISVNELVSYGIGKSKNIHWHLVPSSKDFLKMIKHDPKHAKSLSSLLRDGFEKLSDIARINNIEELTATSPTFDLVERLDQNPNYQAIIQETQNVFDEFGFSKVVFNKDKNGEIFKDENGEVLYPDVVRLADTYFDGKRVGFTKSNAKDFILAADMSKFKTSIERQTSPNNSTTDKQRKMDD